MKKKILVTTSTFAEADTRPLDSLISRGFDVVINPFARKLTEQELHGLLMEHEPVGLLAGVEPVTATVLNDSAGFLRVVSRIGVGWDSVDREAAAALGIKVFRTEGVLDQAVAELAIGFMLAVLRNIALQDREIRSGIWKKRMGALLHGKTLGIIGFGATGQRTGELATAFGATVIYSDICDMDVSIGISVSMDSLLEQSDIISIHASGNEMILGREELSKCRHGVIIINTARGGMVDEEALYACLENGQVAYACMDVFEKEPYEGPLAGLDNVVLSPHVGSYAREARIMMEQKAVENLLKGLELS
jgi:D-3-phosphoglycerate dehydrogenase